MTFDFEKVSRKELAKELEELQREVNQAKFPVLILFEGWESIGKGKLIAEIVKEMDPRTFKVQEFRLERSDQRARPFHWRFWTKIPAKGEFAIFDRSYYQALMGEEARKNGLNKNELEDIEAMEKALVQDGMLIIKLFLETGEDYQKYRIETLSEHEVTAFRIKEFDKDQNKHFKEYKKLYDKLLSKTNFDFAKWHIIDIEDDKEGSMKALHIINESIRRHLEDAPQPEHQYKPLKKKEDYLGQLDLSKKLEKEEYDDLKNKLQDEARNLVYWTYQQEIPIVLVFEGQDAAGKGGAIKRLTRNIDPRIYEVIPISAPSKEEHRYHYLWRFYKELPRKGKMAIFDRSWYGRVLVERIEGFNTEDEWERAYHELNEFEEHLTNQGAILLKFFIHIDKDEQLQRFEARQENKQWKITDEDWRNRDKWDSYQEATNEMFERTSTKKAPWTLVEGNDKRYARIKVLQTFVDAIKERMND